MLRRRGKRGDLRPEAETRVSPQQPGLFKKKPRGSVGVPAGPREEALSLGCWNQGLGVGKGTGPPSVGWGWGLMVLALRMNGEQPDTGEESSFE